MSGRYNRTYSRKKAAPPPISQFDKLVTEPGGSKTKPSATKTAGHVGKWGVTSFTSIRSINGGLGKDEGSKRPYPDSPPSSNSDDAFSFDGGSSTANGAALQVKPPSATYSKPRKFFKSRNVDRPTAEPPKPSDKPPAEKPKKDSVRDVNKVSVAACETPDSSQGSGKDPREASDQSAFDKLVTTTNKANCAAGNGQKTSGSGIKLKIFKSRNVASVSQDTYSSMVELPSDDSRANSACTSSSSSPSTKDATEEHTHPLEEVPSSTSPTPEYKQSQSRVSGQVSSSSFPSPDRLQSPARPLDTTVDSSFEFSGLIDQRTGLPVLGAGDDSDLNFSLNKSASDTPQPTKKTFGSKFTKSDELNKYITNNLVSSAADIDTPNTLSELCSGSLNDDFDMFDVGSSDFAASQEGTQATPPCAAAPPREDSPVVSSGGGTESDNFDLFSTDFDENEIEDRTNLDCGGNAAPPVAPAEKEALADTQEMDDLLFSTQGSSVSQSSSRSSTSYKRSQSVKSEAEAKKDPPPLVKKRSIFKSRETDPKKRATYRHKWHDHEDKDEAAKDKALASSQSSASSSSNAFDFDFDAPTTLKRVHTWPGSSHPSLDDSMEQHPITSVRCAKNHKQFYTVVKNVKRTHQLQESGEFQEFNDDVEYFLDALSPSMPVSTRCLAALNLAQKCMVPAFRMHLRAHGTVIKFFSALADAHSDPRLAICAATVMFTLSQDRLNMDLDRDSLELMLNLLDTDTDAPDNLQVADQAEVDHNQNKIRELCRNMQKKGHAKHLNLSNITAGHLAMETLLSLTSKRAGEWFKEELRELGGIDHLVRTITQCVNCFGPDMESWTHSLLEKLSKVDRCLKVLENVTNQNVANQEYLLTYHDGLFPKRLMALYRICHIEVPLYPVSDAENQRTTVGGMSTGQLLVQTLLTTVKVLINLTHSVGKEALGSKILGKEQETYDITLYCLLIMPRYLTHDNRFEILILTCCLLLNLVEHSKSNRGHLMKSKAPEFMDDGDNIFGRSHQKDQGAMQALVELFYKCEQSARRQDNAVDDLIDNDLTEKAQKEDDKKDDELEETVAKLIQRAGHHMEDTLVAAYTALLTGYCIMEDEECEAEIRLMLPDANFRAMVVVLKKFLHFMDLTATTSLLRSLKPTQRVVKYMEKLDRSAADEEEEERKKREQKEMEFDAFGF